MNLHSGLNARQQRSGRRTRRTGQQKRRAAVLNRRSTEAKRLTQEKLARHRLGLEKKGLRLARVTGKPESNNLQAGKTSSETDGSKNDRLRRVSTEAKKQSAKAEI